MTVALLALNEVSKNFVLHREQPVTLPVLRDVNLQVKPGECVVLDGPSGMGKSTLLKLIYANYLPSGGSICVRRNDGRFIDVARASTRELLSLRHEVIGYVSQFLRAIPRVPTLNVVAEPLADDAANNAPLLEEAKATASALLARLRIPETLWHLPPATFSGGEQQRVNIARGFAKRRPLMLLDEPTASLDRENTQTVIAMINEARQAGSAIVGIFHDPLVRDAVATRVVPMQAFQA